MNEIHHFVKGPSYGRFGWHSCTSEGVSVNQLKRCDPLIVVHLQRTVVDPCLDVGELVAPFLPLLLEVISKDVIDDAMLPLQ
jgi:hypothetical protein